ncbi:ribonucleases P/MRP protein subunit POP1-domain-containing protein [Lipomyces japonicus]|uniref:ribonucleases P/MRP protein subunit POP1-domain-containing protein n=1 Tax=Lipomyces japonicus TaxID=56871 RepID=UPI0034CEAE4E
MTRKGKQNEHDKTTASRQSSTLSFKRLKTLDARTILTDTADACVRDGKLDVTAFVQSRKAEIQNITAAMRRSKTIQKQQTFQAVPRSLRRRAASHHVRFLPPRYRKQGEKDIRDAAAVAAASNGGDSSIRKKKKKFRLNTTRLRLRRSTALRLRRIALSTAAGRRNVNNKRRRRGNPVGFNEFADPPAIGNGAARGKFQRRQRDKTWLPTHLWHAKRAHMTTRWGFAIPSHPNDKVFRPTHRHSSQAAVGGNAVGFDTSYEATMIVFALAKDLAYRINLLTRGAFGIVPGFLPGNSLFEGFVFDDRGLIGTAMICTSDGLEERLSLKLPSGDECMKLILRVHPSIFVRTWNAIQSFPALNEKSVDQFIIIDCRYTIGSIDLIGPRALSVLALNLRCNFERKGFKSPYDLEHASSLHNIATGLASVGNPIALVPGSNAQLTFLDPRTVHVWNIFVVDDLQVSVEHWKRAFLRRKLRERNRRVKDGNTYHQPGEVEYTFEDDVRIPGLLMRRDNGGITLLLPWQWVKIFYDALIGPGKAIFGGLEQYHQIMTERMLPYFPDDFPGTDEGDAEEQRKAAERQAKWEAKPKGKRASYESLYLHNGDVKGEVGNPFACDWQVLFKHDNDGDGEHQQQHLPRWTLVPHYTLARSADYYNGLVQVKVIMISRGVPAPRSRVYAIPADMQKQWQPRQSKRKREAIVPGSDDYPSCPSRQHLIGFVTSGMFNLTEGRGAGVGAVVATKIKQDAYVVVRNVGETVAYLAIMKVYK